MFTSRRSRLVAAAVMPLVLAGGMSALAQSTSSAAGKGAFTTGGHVHGSQAYGAEVITFLPGSGPALPTGCWFTSRDAFFSTSGNGIFHGTFNKNGHWFTNTYTGTAEILPILFTPETPT